MSTLKTLSSSTTIPTFDEQQWVINIRRSLQEELEDDSQVSVCIFTVPKALKSFDPNSYMPQQVSLGPYHYWRLDLYDMERYKLMAAKRYQQRLKNGLKFEDVVEQLEKLETCIRACYHKYLDLSCETLVWMMAIDACFILEFLQVFALEEEGKTLHQHRVSSRGMSHLVDGRKSAHSAILRDIVMLENQIPLFVLRKMLEFEISSLEFTDEILNSMLKGLCWELCPFKRMESFANDINISNHHHILGLLYHIIVPAVEGSSEPIEGHKKSMEENRESTMEQQSSLLMQILKAVWKQLSKIHTSGPLSFIKKLVCSDLMKVILKLPSTILSKIPGVSILMKPCVSFFSSEEEKTNPQNGTSTIHKPPLVEEIAIPSVTDLSKSCVHFSPTKGNISTISFNIETKTLHLPTIILDVNTEVVLRNLVAYEATNACGPLVFTRYTELMNGIIDSAEDVKLLRERGIILNRLKNDGEAADMWNGMSKSIRLTTVPYLDKVIEDVNKYHNSRWSVKACQFFKKKVYSSWRLLTFLATITFLLLLTFQSFCSVYNCSTLLHKL